MFVRIQAAVGSKKVSGKKTIGNGFLFVRIKAAVGLKTVSEKKQLELHFSLLGEKLQWV